MTKKINKKINKKEILERPIELVTIPLKKEDNLLFHKSFVDRFGGEKNARILLLDIIDRYFRSAYFDPGLLDDLGIKLEQKEDI